MHRIVFLLAALLVSSCTAGSPGADMTPAQADSLIRAHAKDSTFLLVDVRTPSEYQMGHLQGARMIDFHGPDFSGEIGKLPRNAPIFLYCRSGNRSSQAIGLMKGMGFKNVHHLAGGMNSWQAEARPVTR